MPEDSKNSPPAIQCKYTCFKCGITRQVVTVRGRLPGEEVVHWMEEVAAAAMSRDHDRRSPNCRITSLSEVLVPIFEDSEIGTPGTVPAHVQDDFQGASPEAKEKC